MNYRKGMKIIKVKVGFKFMPDIIVEDAPYHCANC